MSSQLKLNSCADGRCSGSSESNKSLIFVHMQYSSAKEMQVFHNITI